MLASGAESFFHFSTHSDTPRRYPVTRTAAKLCEATPINFHVSPVLLPIISRMCRHVRKCRRGTIDLPATCGPASTEFAISDGCYFVDRSVLNGIKRFRLRLKVWWRPNLNIRWIYMYNTSWIDIGLSVLQLNGQSPVYYCTFQFVTVREVLFRWTYLKITQ